jgi:hypothetical protein
VSLLNVRRLVNAPATTSRRAAAVLQWRPALGGTCVALLAGTKITTAQEAVVR